MQKEISKEVYDAVMVLHEHCINHSCEDCPFSILNDAECMLFWGNPNGWNENVTEENGHYYVIEDEVTE